MSGQGEPSRNVRVTLGIVLFVLFALLLCGVAPDLFGLFGPKVGHGKRTVAQNSLKQFALAMLNYQAEHHRLPPPAIYGPQGEPLLSWRVAILPFLEKETLYKQFRLEEPWNSPHNLTLLDKMPTIYAYSGPNSVKSLPRHTYFQVLVGKGTAFESREGLRVPEDFPDGSSKTILILEGEPPVPWTKPADLPYDPDRPLPKFWIVRDGGYNAAFADGSVMFLDGRNPDRTRARITRNGGEKIPVDD